jgi:hypothetical protein
MLRRTVDRMMLGNASISATQTIIEPIIPATIEHAHANNTTGDM